MVEISLLVFPPLFIVVKYIYHIDFSSCPLWTALLYSLYNHFRK